MTSPKNMKASKTGVSKERILFLFLFFFVLTYFWFGFDHYNTRGHADDYLLLNSIRHSLSEFLRVQMETQKFRPVFYGVFASLYQLFHDDISKYYWTSALVHVCSCVIFTLIVSTFTESFFVAVAFGVMACISRMALYSLLQVNGIMEALASLFLICSVHHLILFINTKRPCSIAISTLFFALLLFTHERFVVVGPVIILGAVLVYGVKNRKALVTIATVTSIIAINVLWKCALGVKFLTQTESRPIDASIGPKIDMFFAGLASLLGFSQGPEYLAILEHRNFPNDLKNVTIISTIGLTALLVIAALIIKRLKGRRWVTFFNENLFGASATILFCLVCALLASASVSFRQEFRWVYPAHVSYFLLIAVIWTFAERFHFTSTLKPLLWAIFAAIFVQTIYAENTFRQKRDNLYLMSGLTVMQSLKNILITYSKDSLHAERFAIVTPWDSGEDSRADLKNIFGEFDIKFVVYAHDLKALSQENLRWATTVLQLDQATKSWSNITAQVKTAN